MTSLTVQAVRQWGRESLLDARDADELLAFSLNRSYAELPFCNEIISEDQFKNYQALVARRKQGEPLQQILGFVIFLDCRINLTQDVLIPRPETEILASQIIDNLQQDLSPKVIADLCTGSGCLAIALKKAMPHHHVIAIDLSPSALAVAQKNATLNDVTIDFLLGDFLEPFKGKMADVIVSNPPYIAEWEYKELDESVRLYEPKMALIAGPTGIEFYERLRDELPIVLNKPGKVFLEIGYDQGKVMQTIFSNFKGTLTKDYSGHDRYFFLEIQ